MLMAGLSGCEWPDWTAPQVSANTPIVVNGNTLNLYFNATDNRGGNLTYDIVFNTTLNVTGNFSSGDSVNLTLFLPAQDTLNLTLIIYDASGNAARENFFVYIVQPDQESPLIQEVLVTTNDGAFVPRARHFIVVFPFPCVNYHHSGFGRINYTYLDGTKPGAFSYIMAGCTHGIDTQFQVQVFVQNMTQEYLRAGYSYMNNTSGELVTGEVILG